MKRNTGRNGQSRLNFTLAKYPVRGSSSVQIVPHPPKVAIVIPARYASTRFPGKPLVKIGGVTMIERVYRQAQKCDYADDVVVATDDERISEAVRQFGGKVAMTGSHHNSGTDRLAEVARLHPEFDIIINVQGDEPLIAPGTIDAAIAPLLQESSVQMSTVAAPIKDAYEIASNTVVKVVVDNGGNALYFSRFPIPFIRDADEAAKTTYLAHIGLYGYRRETLLKISSAPQTMLERAESLEQLRALENGIRIRVVQVASRSPAIDTPGDLALVERELIADTIDFTPGIPTIPAPTSIS
ncbi:MAG: 3-deoxy-manno-octulosonate cytidylyltransferase [Candidatus Obscuribacterales bacterium]|nr:3-deoxy-manno-octulosonate cytidylyltransferase [Candidatus Obscuribacterales bacterium]